MKIIDKAIVSIMRILNRIHLSITKQSQNISTKEDFNILTPQLATDEGDGYSNALRSALRKNDVKNIAVTGPYGAGKSSFIKRFILENPQWKYLTISLATFNDKSIKDAPSATEKKSRNQDIERSILQQIFYREKIASTPFSRFKRIRHIKDLSIFTHSIILGISALFISLQLFPAFTNKILMLNSFGLVSFITRNHNIITLIALCIYVYYFYKLSRFCLNFQISKFDFKDGKLELNAKNSDRASIFNEYLEEIIYFFEVTKYDIVVIEDLDRFNDTDIFIKLRELNSIINESKAIKPTIRFVYALKDETFVDKERTKFFDFIIPIIPYINPSNSYEIIIKQFKGQNDLDKTFLRNIALFIDDMRLLYNIVNEYRIYKQKLDSDKLDSNKILGMIVYKNFCPADFSMLHFNESVINKIINEKDIKIKNTISQIEKNIKNHQDELNSIEKETIRSINELKILYVGAISIKLKRDKLSTQNQSSQHIAYYTTNNNIDSLIGKTITGEDNSYSYNKPQIQFSDIENDLGNYREREKYINQKADRSLHNIRQKIESSKKDITNLKSAKLCDLIDKIEIGDFLNTKREISLLKYLLSNRLIDEDYYIYISYFHEESITISDREYVLSLKSERYINDFDYKIERPQGVITWLSNDDYQKNGILNYYLIKYLIENNKHNFLEIVKKVIANGSDLSISFIFHFIETENQDVNKFYMATVWKKFWWYIIDQADFSEEKQFEYFRLILNGVEIDKISNFDVNKCLSNYIEKRNTLLELEKDETDKLIEIIRHLNLTFMNLNPCQSNNDLFRFIYENDLYYFNYNNVEKILLYFDENITELETANLTTIRNSKAKKLIKLVNENIESYLESVFLKLQDNTDESKEVVVDLLNNEDISIENKILIIEKEAVRLENIETVDFNAELWHSLMLNVRIKSNWSNLLNYYNKQGSDDAYWSFLNKEANCLPLTSVEIDSESPLRDVMKNITREILESDKLELKVYAKLVNLIQFGKYETLNLENLNEDKIEILLKNDKLEFTQQNIINLRQCSIKKIPWLISNYKNSFIENFDVFELERDEYAQIIESELFDTEYKLNILEMISFDIIQASEALMQAIGSLYVKLKKPISNEIFMLIFTELDPKARITALLVQSKRLDNSQLTTCLDTMGGKYAELYKKSHERLYINPSSENKELLNLLVSKGIISSFKPSLFGDLKVNRKRK